jgi:hypothetical protein
MKSKYTAEDFVKKGKIHILETKAYVYEIRNYEKGKWRINIFRAGNKSMFTYWYHRTLKEAKSAVLREANSK